MGDSHDVSKDSLRRDVLTRGPEVRVIICSNGGKLDLQGPINARTLSGVIVDLRLLIPLSMANGDPEGIRLVA